MDACRRQLACRKAAPGLGMALAVPSGQLPSCGGDWRLRRVPVCSYGTPRWGDKDVRVLQPQRHGDDAMPCCCHHCHYPWHYVPRQVWDWPEPVPPPAPRYAAPSRDAYLERLEEERDL